MTVHVHKFGGTSVGGAKRLREAARILIDAASDGTATVAVSSAMSGVTNDLVAVAAATDRGQLEAALERIEKLRKRHHETADALGATDASDPLRVAIDAHLSDLDAVVRSAIHLGELSPRSQDRLLITGEKLAVRLLARALEAGGARAEALDADTFLDTDDHFGSAEPVREIADRETAAAIRQVLHGGRIPVITGFCGRAPDGATTTLGRGGSDLTATLVAAALRADLCTIWTDVPGVFSADPRLVENPQPLPRLHYREAAEMSYYGAKVLHPRTISPVIRLHIPIRVRSSLAPTEPGTTIDATFTPESGLVKAVTAIQDQCLVSIEGNGMTGVPGVAARTFGALAHHQISATMISQASSEASICFAVPGQAAATVGAALKQAFRLELTQGQVEEITVREGVSLVAAVGIGMAHRNGVAGRVFSSLGRRGINVLAIAQGSSELNISFAVDAVDGAEAVRTIHDEFVTAAATPPGVGRAAPRSVLLLGCGNVGRALIQMARNHPGIRFVGVADRSGVEVHRSGLSPERLDALMAHKLAGGAIGDRPRASRFAEQPLATVVEKLKLAADVLVDVTAENGHETLFAEVARRGLDIVTANKKPLAVDAPSYAALLRTLADGGRTLRAEATAGAGLPILSTITSLLDTGDEIMRIRACLSGTLGYLVSQLEAGAPLSQAVLHAIEHGYTEPDPVADLGGDDVARKAIILARFAGLAPMHRVSLSLEPFIAGLAAGLSQADLLAQIAVHDGDFDMRLDQARTTGATLRYVASVDGSGARVALVEVPLADALATIDGPDNVVVLTTRRYPASNPLVLRGPGAGAEVTASGVLADILSLGAR